MADLNLQDELVLSADSLSFKGVSFQIGNATASTVGFGLSNSGGMLMLQASQTGDVTFGLPTSGGTFLTGVLFSDGANSFVGSQLALSNSNNVSFGLVGSSFTATATFSQSTAPGAIAAGSQTATSGTVAFANANGITFGMSGSSQVTASYTQSTSPAAISAGTASASSGTIVFSNSNNVSFGLNGNTVTASATVASSQGSINVSAGTTSGNLSAAVFSNSNGVSFGLNAGTITGSHAVNVSAGTTSANLSAFTFSNSNGVSFGLNASTVTASVATSLTNVNISAGTTSQNLSNLVFSNGGGITFGLSGSTVTASAVVGSVTQVVFSAGTSSASLSSVVFSNSNNVSFGLNGGTITASANLTGDWYDNIIAAQPLATGSGAMGVISNFTGSVSTLFVAPLHGYGHLFPFDITANTIFFPDVSVSGSTATMSAAFTSAWAYGIYTLNGSSLSLLNSGSITFGFGAAATNNSTAFAGGFRYGSGTSWSSSPVFKQGSRYWLGWFWSSAGALNQTGSMAGAFMYSTGQRSGLLGASNLTATSNGAAPFYGIYSAQTAAMPASIGSNQLQKTGSMAGFVPHFVMANNASLTIF